MTEVEPDIQSTRQLTAEIHPVASSLVCNVTDSSSSPGDSVLRWSDVKRLHNTSQRSPLLSCHRDNKQGFLPQRPHRAEELPVIGRRAGGAGGRVNMGGASTSGCSD